MTDAELLARFVRAADQSAFAEIVNRHAGLVVGAARRLAPLDADDVAQATFFLLARRAARLAGRTSLAGWLYVTATHCARNARRSRKRHERKLVAQAARDFARSETKTNDLAALLDAAIARLPSATRDVILLRHVESLSVAETAARLGVAATTVTKRSERGLSKLRDFFAARGHATLGTAGVAALLATPTSHVDAATLATAATSKASPAVAALATSSLVAPAAAVVALATIAAVATTVAVRITEPPAIAATATASTRVTGSPGAAGLTQDAARSVATAFLDALRDGDRDTLKSLAYYRFQADDFADAALADVRAYAAFPQRLKLGGSSSFTMGGLVIERDGTTRPIAAGEFSSATLESQTPTEADVGRLLLKLSVGDGAWRVQSATFVVDGAMRNGTPLGAENPATTRPVAADVAAAADAAWQRVEAAMRELDPTTLTPDRLPAYRACVVAFRDAVDAFAAALRGTSLALADADVMRLRSMATDLVSWIDRESFDAVKGRLDGIGKDAAISASTARLFDAVRQLHESMDASDDSADRGPRVASFGPDVPVTLSWSGEHVRIRGPLQVPDWLFKTQAWKRWEFAHDVRTFHTRDDAGNAYEIDVSGAVRQRDGSTTPSFRAVRRYRPDGTLAALASFIGDRPPSEWGELDETGRRYTFRATMGWVDAQTPFLRDVRFFAADGTIRAWEVRAARPNVVHSEWLADPIGDHQEWNHLPNSAGRETIRTPEDLPSDGLPIDRE